MKPHSYHKITTCIPVLANSSHQLQGNYQGLIDPIHIEFSMHGVGQQINVVKPQSVSCKIANACLATCEGTICLSVLTTVTMIENFA